MRGSSGHQFYQSVSFWAALFFLLVFLVYVYSPSSCHCPQETNGVAPSTNNKHAIAYIKSSDEKISGVVKFVQEGGSGPVSVLIKLSGVPPGAHGFHIHEFGDVSTCAAAGIHFNPHSVSHGGPHDKTRHVGDLGNVEGNDDGTLNFEFEDSVISLNGLHSIIGKAVVLHEQPDDLGKGGQEDSHTTGHAGARLACGSIVSEITSSVVY